MSTTLKLKSFLNTIKVKLIQLKLMYDNNNITTVEDASGKTFATFLMELGRQIPEYAE
jgi:hypothetical protein